MMGRCECSAAVMREQKSALQQIVVVVWLWLLTTTICSKAQGKLVGNVS